jgi:hypothetical protein
MFQANLCCGLSRARGTLSAALTINKTEAERMNLAQSLPDNRQPLVGS